MSLFNRLEALENKKQSVLSNKTKPKENMTRIEGTKIKSVLIFHYYIVGCIKFIIYKKRNLTDYIVAVCQNIT